jgi:hypothetical protein
LQPRTFDVGGDMQGKGECDLLVLVMEKSYMEQGNIFRAHGMLFSILTLICMALPWVVT